MNGLKITLEDLKKKYGAILDKDPSVKIKKISERSVILEEIRSEVNRERLKEKFYIQNGKKKELKLMGGAEIAIKLSHIPTEHLYYLKSICLDYKQRSGSFSKCLFGSIKVK